MSRALFDSVEHKRTIIDRRSIADGLAAIKPGKDRTGYAVKLLRSALEQGRAEVARRLSVEPDAGRSAARATAYLHDQIVRLTHDFVALDGEPPPMAIVGLGGTGRGEMAPFSDVDLMFLTKAKPTPQHERLVEAVLKILWDLKLKVGHSIRSTSDLLTYAKSDMTVRTALLEARLIWGDRTIFDDAMKRFRAKIVTGTTAEFVAAKLAERDERHKRMGDSRYVVEPNVKDGKGGLRDLHTLYWIGKYVHGVEEPADLVRFGLFTAAEFKKFERAERFFWAVRCHLHLAANRAEERLGFDNQRHIAEVMRYADRPGKSAVERFMQFYFLNAKTVGDLTGIFLAQLDEQLAKKGFRFTLPTLRRKPKRLAGFTLDRGRLSIPTNDYFAEDPVRMVEIFAHAAREQLEIHPAAMRAASRDAKLIDEKVRNDPRANAFFMDVLTCVNAPELVLRWMNEAGVFGRFVPDFGRVVAQMQFDMYHHYTVDEHTVRAIGLLAAIERGELKKDHPLSSALFKQLGSRRTLYVAVLLHDIAKGRGGDHSELGADIALKLGPRFGLDPAETETVAWLVRYHLLMSATAFKRDLADPKTIEDFVQKVQSPERLRLLLILTVVDIRAVGPGVWNEWKRVLLSTLFDSAEERLRLGHKQRGRTELVDERKQELVKALGWKKSAANAYIRRLPDSYWLAEPPESQLANARQVASVEAQILNDEVPRVAAEEDVGSASTRVSVYAPDREGLFYRICAGLAAAGASIIDARIHTTRDGMALDNLLVQDGQGRAYSDRRLRNRLIRSVESALSSVDLPVLPRTASPGRSAAFRVAPSVTVAEKASSRTTVVEVNARDRPALLARLAGTIRECGYVVHSAHIATYGERAVDVFYMTRVDGHRLDGEDIDVLRAALLAAAGETAEAAAA